MTLFVRPLRPGIRRGLQAARILVLRLAVAATMLEDAAAQPAEPTLRASRASRAPVIDGRLDDPDWTLALQTDDFRQRDPDEGQPATERTVLRVLFDDEHLYIGAELFERDPRAIRATELRRDNELEGDDTFTILLDTYHDHRNAFLFRVNPHGARYDAVIRNESRLDPDWDEQWWAETSVGAHGWTVEIAIPFRTLRFAESGVHVWGMDVERIIRRRNEAVYWANWDRDFDFEQVSRAGHLGGLEGIRQGQRIRLRPYLVAGADWFGATAGDVEPRDPVSVGIDDLKVALTSNLTADLTLNPDFAQTEIDEQRVNLTRFSLFFPEKRQFFLEGADSLRMGPPVGDFDEEELELFHSRRIGLTEAGAPVPIIGGAKLTGKVGGVDLGALSAWTRSDRGEPAAGYAAGRFRRELLRQSYVGAIATIKHAAGEERTTLGADARFVLKDHLALSGLIARADGLDGTADWARHGGVSWDDDLVQASVAYLDVDPAFDPAIGFVRRRDRQVDALFSFNPRPSGGPIRQFEFTPAATVNHDRSGNLLSRELEFGVEAGFQSGDEIEVGAERIRELLTDPFEISDGIELPVGAYDWNSYEVGWRTFEGRAISGSVSAEAGGFYNGTRRALELSGALRLGSHLAVRPEYEMNDVSLPQGAFRTHLLGVRTDVALSTDLLTSVFYQYNSERDLGALQVRLNYIFRSIDSFYLVYNESRVAARGTDRSLVAKVTYSLNR